MLYNVPPTVPALRRFSGPTHGGEAGLHAQVDLNEAGKRPISANSTKERGEGLGAMWGAEKTREYLHRAGFSRVEKHELAHDIQNNWYVVRK